MINKVNFNKNRVNFGKLVVDKEKFERLPEKDQETFRNYLSGIDSNFEESGLSINLSKEKFERLPKEDQETFRDYLISINSDYENFLEESRRIDIIEFRSDEADFDEKGKNFAKDNLGKDELGKDKLRLEKLGKDKSGKNKLRLNKLGLDKSEKDKLGLDLAIIPNDYNLFMHKG